MTKGLWVGRHAFGCHQNATRSLILRWGPRTAAIFPFHWYVEIGQYLLTGGLN